VLAHRTLQVSQVVSQDDFESGMVVLTADVSARLGGTRRAVQLKNTTTTNVTLSQNPAMTVSIVRAVGQAEAVDATGESLWDYALSCSDVCAGQLCVLQCHVSKKFAIKDVCSDNQPQLVLACVCLQVQQPLLLRPQTRK
jgi:hypothetical protein